MLLRYLRQRQHVLVYFRLEWSVLLKPRLRIRLRLRHMRWAVHVFMLFRLVGHNMQHPRLRGRLRVWKL